MHGNGASIRTAFPRNMILVVLAALFLWGAIWIHDEYSAFRSESETIREAYLNSRKALLREEVSRVVDYIGYMKGQTEKRLKADIRERVEEALNLARHIYEKNRDLKPAGDIQDMIRDVLRQIRFNNGRGYYFAISMDGRVELFADRPEMEGADLLRVWGTAGEKVARDMIELVRESGEGFYRYPWTKPDAPDKNHPKIAFLKRFEPYDWIIGTGEYLDDVAAEIRNEVLERLVTLRFGAEGYFFGSTYTGDPLFSNGKITRGTGSVWDLTDPDGVKIIQSQYQTVKDRGRGFVRYVWPRLNYTQPSPKISYVAGIDDWRWIIGAGVYLDSVEQTIAEKKVHLRAGLEKKLLKSGVLFIALFLLILVWARLMSGRVRKSLLRFSNAFRRAVDDATPIDPRELHFAEFREIAEFANRMMLARKDAEKALRESEEKLRHAHKMEAVGTMAGGIAHEFNNVLGIILGNTELVMEDVGAAHPARKNLDQIRKATMRARDVVRQLLNFSRMSSLNRSPIRLQEVIRDALKVLRASIPRSVRIDINLSEQAGGVMGDPGQIHQLLLNVCANAAHAMPDGGTLSIGLAEVHAAALPGGKGIQLTVSDTGHGIDPAIMEKIFDPYFTTRDQGKGTGMGLAVVHGIVENHGGEIAVDSAPGKGTTVRMLFPKYRETPSAETISDATVASGSESILFIDDESVVATTGKQLLERLGYRVEAVTDSRNALEIFKTEPGRYDLVITDMTMPGLSGDALASSVLAIRPDIPVILCTGFSEKINGDRARRLGIRCYLEKPFEKARLARAVRRALDGDTVAADSARLAAC